MYDFILSALIIIVGFILICMLVVLYYQHIKKEFNIDLPLTPNKGIIINFDGEKTIHIGMYGIK